MKVCENCSNEHDGEYGSGRFCSTKCSSGFSTKAKRKEINKKVSKTLTKNPYVKICKNCKTEYETKRKTQKFCSNSCTTTYNNKNLGLASKAGKASAEKRVLRSKNEIYFAELCSSTFEILTNKKMFNGWDADVIISSLKIAILWNGKWHYEKIREGHSIKQVQNRDKIKINEIKNAGYTPYIIKDMGKHNKVFVDKEFEKFLKYIAG